jgi:hypothetical protein
MGHTDFTGSFDLDRPLAPEHKAYLTRFAETRRVVRDVKALMRLGYGDPLREAVGLGLGVDGGYFVDINGGPGEGVIDDNTPPEGQPGLWCQWVPNENGTEIEWDGAEKFYRYTEWLEYLIEHFLKPWGYKLNGRVVWRSDSNNDSGVIYVKDNKVKAVADELVRREPDWEKE